MKSTLLATVSVSVLALGLNAPVFAQSIENGAGGLLQAPTEKQLRKLQKLCEAGKKLPEGLDCSMLDALIAAPADQAQDAPTAESEPEQAVAPEPQPTPEAPAAEADTKPEPQADTATVKPGKKPKAKPADKPQPPAVAELLKQLGGQEQADAQAVDNDTPAAAAAGGDGRNGQPAPEVIEQTITDEDVRRSSEDFATSVLTGKKDKAKDKDKDDKDSNIDVLAGVALLGLGAVVLADILSDDQRVVSNSGDRVVIEDKGQLRVLRNDDQLLNRPGAEVQTYRYDDGSTRNVMTYDDGTVVETIRAADGRVLRRTRTLADGTEVVLFDDTQVSERVVVSDLPQFDDRQGLNYRDVAAADLAAALAAQQGIDAGRSFSLSQIRNIDAVRKLVPEITVDTINFATGSAAIRPEEAEELAALGNAMRRMIDANPAEVFLIEGHTDAVGQASYNLALSDRRAESVALALTEYFGVPPENLVLQGYGEGDLLIQTELAERANRRAAVRRITPLLR